MIPSRRAIGTLMLLEIAVLAASIQGASATFDEYAHLAAGIAYWSDAAWSIHNLSPPLARLWAAAPAYLAGANAPPTAPFLAMDPSARHWAYGEAFLRMNFDRYADLVVLGRLAMIPIACIGLWLTIRWAASLYGPRAGLGAGALFVLSPNIAGHFGLVSTDAFATVGLLAASWAWWRACLRPTPGRVALTGLLTGLAHLIKHTALLLWPIFVLTAAITRAGRSKGRSVALALMPVLALALALFGGLYKFEGAGRSLESYAFRSDAMQRVQRALPNWLPVPVPEQAVIGFDVQKFEADMPGRSYLLGTVYEGSRAGYYPLALASKTPLSTLLLLVLALATAALPTIRGPSTRTGARTAAAAAGVLTLGMVGLSSLNIGVRYLLPALPFAFILASRVFALERARLAGAVLLALLAFEHASVAPRYLGFINQAAGGPAAGPGLFRDSNVDWGQGLHDLRDWMHDEGVEHVQLAYFGSVDPGAYGISYTPLILETAGPVVPTEAEYVVVSSFFAAGLTQRMPTPSGRTGHLRLDFHEHLAKRQPAHVVADTMLVYRRQDVLAAWSDSQ